VGTAARPDTFIDENRLLTRRRTGENGWHRIVCPRPPAIANREEPGPAAQPESGRSLKTVAGDTTAKIGCPLLQHVSHKGPCDAQPVPDPTRMSRDEGVSWYLRAGRPGNRQAFSTLAGMNRS
jgi:hypothetical protein